MEPQIKNSFKHNATSYKKCAFATQFTIHSLHKVNFLDEALFCLQLFSFLLRAYVMIFTCTKVVRPFICMGKFTNFVLFFW